MFSLPPLLHLYRRYILLYVHLTPYPSYSLVCHSFQFCLPNHGLWCQWQRFVEQLCFLFESPSRFMSIMWLFLHPPRYHTIIWPLPANIATPLTLFSVPIILLSPILLCFHPYLQAKPISVIIINIWNLFFFSQITLAKHSLGRSPFHLESFHPALCLTRFQTLILLLCSKRLFPLHFLTKLLF